MRNVHSMEQIYTVLFNDPTTLPRLASIELNEYSYLELYQKDGAINVDLFIEPYIDINANISSLSEVLRFPENSSVLYGVHFKTQEWMKSMNESIFQYLAKVQNVSIAVSDSIRITEMLPFFKRVSRIESLQSFVLFAQMYGNESDIRKALTSSDSRICITFRIGVEGILRQETDRYGRYRISLTKFP
jgi:hypothetical protein